MYIPPPVEAVPLDFPIAVNSLWEPFENHFAGNNIKDISFGRRRERNTEVRGRMAALTKPRGEGPTEYPVFFCDKLTFSILRSELSENARFRPNASWPGNKVCVRLTAAAAAAGGDHHTFNCWAPLTFLRPQRVQKTHADKLRTQTHMLHKNPKKTCAPTHSFHPAHAENAHRI